MTKRRKTRRTRQARQMTRRRTRRRTTRRRTQKGGMHDSKLQKFRERYGETHSDALSSIQNGKKKGHWSWWIWPISEAQAQRRSRARREYSLTDDEAKAFLSDAPLRAEWLQIMRAVSAQLSNGISLDELATSKGGVNDAWVVRGSCNLFMKNSGSGSDVHKVCSTILGKASGPSPKASGPSAGSAKPMCRYGAGCYRKDKCKFSHPAVDHDPGLAQAIANSLKDRPMGGASGPGASGPGASGPGPGASGPGPGGAAGPGPGPKRNKVSQVGGTTHQRIAYEESIGRNRRTGILIAGNAGLPGGALGKHKVGGKYLLDGAGTLWAEPRKYSTQEESVVNSWFHGVFIEWGGILEAVQQVFRKNIGNETFEPAINGATSGTSDHRPWGLRWPAEALNADRAKSTATLQGHDYTESFVYRDVKDHMVKYDFCLPVKDQPLAYDPGSGFKLIQTSLFFTFGPNIASGGRDKLLGTMSRTLVSDYDYRRDYPIFRAGVKQAYRTSLETMQRSGVQVPILCRISGGIYSGKISPTNTQINSEYVKIINEIIADGDFDFDEIIIC